MLQVKLDEKLVVETLRALNDARITYPGKSERAAELILDKVLVTLFTDSTQNNKPIIVCWLVYRAQTPCILLTRNYDEL